MAFIQLDHVLSIKNFVWQQMLCRNSRDDLRHKKQTRHDYAIYGNLNLHKTYLKISSEDKSIASMGSAAISRAN
jgi:hypothetical protein